MAQDESEGEKLRVRRRRREKTEGDEEDKTGRIMWGGSGIFGQFGKIKCSRP